MSLLSEIHIQIGDKKERAQMAKTSLPAMARLELTPRTPAKVMPNGVKLGQVAMVRPGGTDVYRLKASAPSGSMLGNIHTPPKK